jgi:hypothetical protein
VNESADDHENPLIVVGAPGSLNPILRVIFCCPFR